MITRLSIRNFQSLHVVDLDLAQFTVIVGPSSSGKSALVRAIRTLASNARGTGFISTWAKRTVIEADLADTTDPETHRGTLTLTRGKKADENAYEIAPPPGPMEDAPSSRFTKLGGAVPPEVTAFLGIEPGDSLRLASQFDHPYLLDDAPGEVARTLAALTNVDTVLAAAREANRTRMNAGTVLRHRQADLDAASTRLERFTALKTWIPAVQAAEAGLQGCFILETRIKNLTSALSRLEAAERVISRTAPLLARPVPSLDTVDSLLPRMRSLTQAASRLKAAQERLDAAPAPRGTLPSLDRLEAAHRAHEGFRAVLVRLKAAGARVTAAQEDLGRTTEVLEAARSDYAIALRQAGACPTCGQTTGHLEEIHV